MLLRSKNNTKLYYFNNKKLFDFLTKRDILENMIARRMKLVVENSGESQTAVAEKLGISQPRLNQYINGKREADYAFITKFCHYFHTTPNYLFEFDNDDINEQPLDCFINIIEKIEAWSLKHKIVYNPSDKAELVRLIFKKVCHLPEKQQNDKIADFMEVYETIRKAN